MEKEFDQSNTKTCPAGLIDLFNKTYSERLENCIPLEAHASTRRYYILKSKSYETLGATGDDPQENKAFVKLAKHLTKNGVNVPRVISHTDDYKFYIQELCDQVDLFSLVTKYPEKQIELLTKAIDLLVNFQKKGTIGWDYSDSYPFKSFDSKEINNNFKRLSEYLLGSINISFNKKILDDFEKILIREIESIPKNEYVLMHRDFQSRNILINKEIYTLIDFQGSRSGPKHYDLASLLFQSRINWKKESQEYLLNYYLNLNKEIDDRDLFIKNFYFLGAVRIIQALGSYGIAIYLNNKKSFLASITPALKNLREITEVLNKRYKINTDKTVELIDELIIFFSKNDTSI
ncbi:MAG: phosphotransferase [Rickettsiaceae bacterium]|nr:phosphotransferase [Rickettsiaceae bacterium]USN94510.1 MAG: phosphotransferase [Candidatus Nomurabacteria bacterium]